ncbi:MAG: hypothetical protein SWY16_11115 [Cyanobacteriota bacterium]|nr:hypothetical protein [Cyanobacteriota bacterium]
MSDWIRTGKFSIYSLVYFLASIIIFFAAAFTINGAIIYGLTIIHLYPLFFAYILSFLFRKKTFIRFKLNLFCAMLVFQVLTILSSPASCMGTKQGEACYCFLQAQLMDVSRQPPHWIFESIFSYALFLYLATNVVFLAKIQGRKEISRSGINHLKVRYPKA